MSATDLTMTEITESLTGFDEIAIQTHMGLDVYADAEAKPMVLLRSLVFVHQTREGLTAPAAKAHALGMSAKDASDYFADEPEEIDPDDPDTDAGKGSSSPAPEQVSSLPSAS